jgi:hypothetical protein
MDHGNSFGALGAAAFWIFIGIAAWASQWARSRRNTEKHETMRRIIDKTGTVDEARLKELFNSEPSDWMSNMMMMRRPDKPGDGYRGLMVGGTIVLSIAAGIALLFLIMGQAGVIPQKAMIIGMAAACVPAMVGCGLFFATRFVERPPGNPDSRSVR